MRQTGRLAAFAGAIVAVFLTGGRLSVALSAGVAREEGGTVKLGYPWD